MRLGRRSGARRAGCEGQSIPADFLSVPVVFQIRNLSMEEVGEPWRKGNEDPVSIQELETKKNQAAHTY